MRSMAIGPLSARRDGFGSGAVGVLSGLLRLAQAWIGFYAPFTTF